MHSDLNALDIGKAAEHLVCADLLTLGYQAFLSEQGLAYDVIVDIDGRLIRVQVKGTVGLRAIPQRAAYTPAYLWHVRRAGKGGRRVYRENEFDMLALVALDTKQIAYMPPSTTVNYVQIRPDGAPTGKQFAHYPAAKAFEEILA